MPTKAGQTNPDVRKRRGCCRQRAPKVGDAWFFWGDGNKTTLFSMYSNEDTYQFFQVSFSKLVDKSPHPRDRMPGIKSLILIVHHPIFALLADLSQGISEISWLTDHSGKRFRSTCQKDQHREGGIFATFCLDLQEYFSTGRSPSNSLSSSTLEINP